jgi:OFA family oxalate/formate antiporter-like MFS transporter
MLVSSFGLSLVLFAPLTNSLLSRLGVPATFVILGIIFWVICGTCSFFIQNPPEGYFPDGYVPPQSNTKRHYSPKEIFKTKQYYLLFGGVFFTMPAYFILNPIFLSLGTERGLSAQLALIGVSLTGISSAAGRLAVAWISDKFGRKAAMIGIAVIILCASLLMIMSQGILFLICIMLISFGFGGCASVYGAMTTDSFGTKYGGMNFGLVNIGFGAAALIFPMVSSRLASTGSYTSSFLLAAAASVVAIVLVLLMKNPE